MRYVMILIVFLAAHGVFGQQARERIQTAGEFTKLAGSPLSSKYGNVHAVKVILDTRNQKVYFINSKHYRYHYEFCTQSLFYPSDLFVFNERNYSANYAREYLLANINHNSSTNAYYIDLSVFDLMPTARITELYQALKARTFFGEQLALLLNTERLLAMKDSLPASLPTLTPADLYGSARFQSVSEGTTRGVLRFESSLDSLTRPLRPTDIVITTNTPSYLPVIRGMLLTAFQTPLSHLVILGKNRRIPIGVVRNVFQDSLLRALEGQTVEMRILSDTFLIKPVTSLNFDVPGHKLTHLRRDLTVDTLIGVASLNPYMTDIVGNKATNFGVLYTISQTGYFRTPEAAFAIPFYWYDQHMRKSGAQTLVDSLLAHVPADRDSLDRALKAIRKRILRTPLDPGLEAAILQRLRQSGFETFRFRSSTNAEDAAGFSGAGLYDSKTVDLADSSKSAAIALRKVWSSLWSLEAFSERRYYGMSDEQVAMGVLVHRSFPQEAANGVAITKNIYRDGYSGFVVNVQLGDVSVVTPPDSVQCDQLVLYPANALSGFQKTTEVITTSSLNKGSLVLSERELVLLQDELERIKHYFWQTMPRMRKGRSYDNFGLDIEFKFDGPDRQLYIKQVRLFND